MSDLTESLDRIVGWLHQQIREHPEATKGWWPRPITQKNNSPLVKPGLSSTAIEEITQNLGRQLSPEVYELYKWGNGTKNYDSIVGFDWLFDVGQGWGFFMAFGFSPLQVAVSESLRRKKGKALTIFIGSDCREGDLVFDEGRNYFPIIFRDFKGGADDTIIKYDSLVTMMLTVADCYEQAYYIDSRGYHKDEDKALEIWKKYNSCIII